MRGVVKNTFIEVPTFELQQLAMRRQKSDSDLLAPLPWAKRDAWSSSWGTWFPGSAKAEVESNQTTDVSSDPSTDSETSDLPADDSLFSQTTRRTHSSAAGDCLPHGTTTLMLRRLPVMWQQEDLENWLKPFFSDCYDFAYLPKNEVTGKGRGFAFLNFKTPEDATSFYRQADGQFVKGGRAALPLSVCPARVQGLEANQRQLEKRLSGRRETL